MKKTNWSAFLERIEPSVYRAKGFFKVKSEGWEKVDVVGKKLDYAPYEAQETVRTCIYLQDWNRTDPGD